MFGALILGIDRAVTEPWVGAVLHVVSGAGLVILVRRELPRAHPIVPFDLLRLRSFRLSVIASICCFTAQMSSLVALPFYLQHGLGQSAGMTGLYLTAWPLTVAVAGPLSGRLSDRFSTGTLCAVGGACLAASLLLTAFWPLQGNLLPLVPFMMLGGLGFGFFQTPNNRNMLLGRDPSVDGMKTGYTDAAGYCLVGSAVRDMPNGKRRLLSVVLGTASREARASESQKLLNWGYSAWDDVRLFPADKPAATVPVWKGQTPTAALGAGGAMVVTVPKGEGDKLKTTLERTDPLVAPLAKGQRVGTLKVTTQGGLQVAAVPLVVLEPVEQAGLLGRAWDSIRLWIK